MAIGGSSQLTFYFLFLYVGAYQHFGKTCMPVHRTKSFSSTDYKLENSNPPRVFLPRKQLPTLPKDLAQCTWFNILVTVNRIHRNA